MIPDPIYSGDGDGGDGGGGGGGDDNGTLWLLKL